MVLKTHQGGYFHFKITNSGRTILWENDENHQNLDTQRKSAFWWYFLQKPKFQNNNFSNVSSI
jgi:hypothetical protein